MSSIWFTSDPHFGHQKVASIRGFGSVAEHDTAIFDNWCSVVRDDDHVWVLGDLAVSSANRVLPIIAGLPGIKHLVAGNHDACHPMHRDAWKVQSRYLEVFRSVQPFARRRINGVEVFLSHFPYSTDHTFTPRFNQYRLRDEGAWLLHGHTHGPERLHGHEIHVGVDAWDLRPVPESTIATLMAA